MESSLTIILHYPCGVSVGGLSALYHLAQVLPEQPDVIPLDGQNYLLLYTQGIEDLLGLAVGLGCVFHIPKIIF